MTGEGSLWPPSFRRRCHRFRAARPTERITTVSHKRICMETLQHLLDSNRNWAKGAKMVEQDFFEKLSAQQTPRVLVDRLCG